MEWQDEILDAAPYGTLVVDGKDELVFANRWIVRNSGKDLSAFVGREVWEICNPSLMTQRQLRMARMQGRPVVLSQKLHGYLIPMPLPAHHISGFLMMQQEAYVVPLSNGHLVITVRDVTPIVVGERKLKQLQVDIEEARSRAERSDRKKGKFLAMMSHDIRTPLSGMLGYADLLADAPLDDPHASWAQMIRSSGGLLLNLVNDILDYSKLEDGKMSIKPGPFDVRSVVREVVDVFIPEAHRKGLEVEVFFSDKVGVLFYQDQMRVRQILANLMSNAVKFTASGRIGLEVDLQVGYGAIADRLLVSVSDSGDGIPIEAQKQLFQAYQQVEGEHSVKGTGLGLHISRELCLLMGGEISVRSEPGAGSVFSFAIRSAASHCGDEAGEKSCVAGDPDGELFRRQADQKSSLRILVVDDSQVNCRLMATLLVRRGHTVTTALDADEAIKFIEKGPLDLVILDLLLPRMSGFDLAKALRRGVYGELNRWSALCALSGLSASELNGTLSDYGFNFHLLKPVEQKELDRVLGCVFECHPE